MRSLLKKQIAALAYAVEHAPPVLVMPVRTSVTTEAARDKRRLIVEWVSEVGEKTASEVADHFGLKKTTAHSHLTQLVAEGAVLVINATPRRFFVNERD